MAANVAQVAFPAIFARSLEIDMSEACKTGDLEKLTHLFRGWQISTEDLSRLAVLALDYGQYGVLPLLLEKGALVDANAIAKEFVHRCYASDVPEEVIEAMVCSGQLPSELLSGGISRMP